MQLRSCTHLAIAALLTFAPLSRAVVLQASGTRNTTAPAGALEGSGWQYEGTWRNFNSTPISKKYFITAQHIQGGVGEKFRINGRVFTTTAMWDDPNSDLRIFTVNKKFDAWAPLYTDIKETGKHAMIIGKGRARGSEVRLNNVPKGWEWGTADGAQAWGINQVDLVLNGDPGEGQLLQFDFDNVNPVFGESTISEGDSAGGVFIYNKPNKRWELAGVSYSVDGPFRRTSSGSDLQASLFDFGGFFYSGQFINDTAADVPQRFFATRISSNMPWITGVFNGTISPTSVPSSETKGNVPEPAGAMLLGIAACFSRRPSQRRNAIPADSR